MRKRIVAVWFVIAIFVWHPYPYVEEL